MVIIRVLMLMSLAVTCLFGADQVRDQRELTNARYMEGFKAFAKERRVKFKIYGKGAFRLYMTAGTQMRPKEVSELVKLGELALKGLEYWTGRQGMFQPRSMGEKDVYCVVVLDNIAMFDSLVKYLRKNNINPVPNGGADLTMVYKKLPSIRCCFMPEEKMRPIEKNWVVHLTVSMALNVYYYERGEKVPVWLLVGAVGEMERKLCKSIKIYLVQYEKNDGLFGGVGKWNKDFAQLIKKGSKHELMTAFQAMNTSLIGPTYNQYIQLWSVGAFIKEGTARGRKGNKYAEIIRRTAQGEMDLKVVTDVIGVDSERKLTKVWHRWVKKR